MLGVKNDAINNIIRLVRKWRTKKTPNEILSLLQKEFPPEELKNFLLYNWYLVYGERKRTELGAYYTPDNIVELGKRELEALLGSLKEYVILDPACGCGSFLFKNWNAKKVIGADIDPNVVEIISFLTTILKKSNIKVIYTNSLCKADREKFGIEEKEKLIVVGNPPYNDKTSKNKRNVKRKIQELECIDEELKKKDIGMSFFELCVKLKAEAVCLVHPFSYFIKKRNYDQLANFFAHYRLMVSYVFSSNVFNTRRIPFPMAISVFLRNIAGSSWEFLQRFPYKILNTNMIIIPERIETCDGYIDKYGKKECFSETGLFFFNFRDINSLIANGAFSENTNCRDYIPIKKKDLYKYAYLNSLKHHWKPKEDLSYVFGNFSPLCRREHLENRDYQALFLADAIIHNYKKIKQFDFRRPNSLVVASGILKQILETTRWDLGKKFHSWMKDTEKEKNLKNEICVLVQEYFNKLKREMLYAQEEPS